MVLEVTPSSIKEFTDAAPIMSARNVDQYMSMYGAAIGSEARRLLSPLHDPSKDDPTSVTSKRPPFPAQAHVVVAMAKCLIRKKACALVGEMGTGKTICALLAILEHMKQIGKENDGFRAIIMCPGHLVHKWAREINDTVPDARVVILRKWSDIIGLHKNLKYARPARRMFFVISRDTAKLGPAWHPVYHVSKYTVKKDEFNEPAAHCMHCNEPAMSKDKVPISLTKFDNNKYFCETCKAHMWSYDTSGARKWAPAQYIKSKMKGYFNYLVIDEAHEEKSAGSEQAQAAGALITATQHQIILTGTLMGGYAEDIRPLLFRLCGSKMKERGYTWAGSTQFIRDYGRIDTIITETEGGANATGKGKKVNKREKPRPGIMPPLFGDLLMDWTVFISLNEISENLPSFHEEVIAVDMDGVKYDEEGKPIKPDLSDDECPAEGEAKADGPSQYKAYCLVEKALSQAVKEMLARNDRRLLATMLQTLLSYADHPFKWNYVGYWDRPKPGLNIKNLESNQGIKPDVDAAHDAGEEAIDDDSGEPVDLRKRHKKVTKTHTGVFVPICKPPNLDESIVFPKERALLDLMTRERKAGRQVWIYVQNTNKRDVLARLQKVLGDAGFKGKVLRSNTVKPIDREQWIYDNGRGLDYVVSHPKLVQTGMDLFDKGGNHNFVTLVFYQTGYETVTLRQASRRSWRIGQNKPCFVYYIFYKQTLQSAAMELMGTKIKASMQVEGKFSAEGLASMCDDTTGIEMALAKKLASLEEADDHGTIRAWERIGGVANDHSLNETIVEAEEGIDESLLDVTDVTEEQAMADLQELLESLTQTGSSPTS